MEIFLAVYLSIGVMLLVGLLCIPDASKALPRNTFEKVIDYTIITVTVIIAWPAVILMLSL